MILMGPECTDIIQEIEKLEESLKEALALDGKLAVAVNENMPKWEVLASPAESIRNSLPQAVNPWKQ